MLDTCLGRPAPGVGVTLARLAPSSAAAWETVAAGATNRDGRIPDLLPPADWVQPGRYRITFDVADYQVGGCWAAAVGLGACIRSGGCDACAAHPHGVQYLLDMDGAGKAPFINHHSTITPACRRGVRRSSQPSLGRRRVAAPPADFTPPCQ